MAAPACVWNPQSTRQRSPLNSERWRASPVRSDMPVSLLEKGRGAVDVEDSLRMNLQQVKHELVLRDEENRLLRAAVTHLEITLAQRERELRDTVMCLRGDCPPQSRQERLQVGASTSKLRLQVQRLQRVAAAKQDHIDHLNRKASLGFLREAQIQIEEYRAEAKRLASSLVAATGGIGKPFRRSTDHNGDDLRQSNTSHEALMPCHGSMDVSRAATRPSKRVSSPRRSGQTSTRTECRASFEGLCSPARSKRCTVGKARAESMVTSARFRARVQDSIQERIANLDFREELLSIREARVKRARKRTVLQQKTASYRAERLRELNARLARGLQAKTSPDGGGLRRVWEAGDRLDSGRASPVDRECIDYSTAPLKQSREIGAVIVAATKGGSDEGRPNFDVAEPSRYRGRGGPSIEDRITSRDGIQDHKSPEGRRVYEDCLRGEAGRDGERVSPIRPHLGRPPLHPFHRVRPKKSDNLLPSSMLDENGDCAGMSSIREEDSLWDGDEDLDEVQTEAASVGSGGPVDLWGDEDDDADSPEGENVGSLMRQWRGEQEDTPPELTEREDHDHASRCTDGERFPQRRTLVGKENYVDSGQGGQREYTTWVERGKGGWDGIKSRTIFSPNVALAKQQRSSAQSQLSAELSIAKTGPPGAAVVGTYFGGDLGTVESELNLARASKVPETVSEVDGCSETRYFTYARASTPDVPTNSQHYHRQVCSTKFEDQAANSWTTTGNQDNAEPYDDRFGCAASFVKTAKKMQWCGPRGLEEKRRIMTLDRGRKGEDRIFSPGTGVSDSLRGGERLKRERSGTSAENTGFEPRLENGSENWNTRSRNQATKKNQEQTHALIIEGSRQAHEGGDRLEENCDRFGPNRCLKKAVSKFKPTKKEFYGDSESNVKERNYGIIDGHEHQSHGGGDARYTTLSQSGGKMDKIATAFAVAARLTPMSRSELSPRVDPTIDNTADEWMINEPPRKPTSHWKRPRQPHSTRELAGPQSTLVPPTKPRETAARSNTEDLTVVSQLREEIPTRGMNVLGFESSVQQREDSTASTVGQQHLAQIAVGEDGGSDARAAHPVYRQKEGSITSTNELQAARADLLQLQSTDVNIGNIVLSEGYRPLVAVTEALGGCAETPQPEQSVKDGGGSLTRWDTQYEPRGSPRNPGYSGTKISTTLTENHAPLLGDEILEMKGISANMSHADLRVQLVESETLPRSGEGESLRKGELVGLSTSVINSAPVEDKMQDAGPKTEMAATTAPEKAGEEGMFVASHIGDSRPKGTRSTPLPPAIVTFDSEGRSPVADKAEAAAAAITEGGHHLLGSDIPRNLARGLKASATSFPSLSSDSISKSSADEQSAPASAIANQKTKSLHEDTSGSVNGGLEAEVLSTEDAYRLIFDDHEDELSDTVEDNMQDTESNAEMAATTALEKAGEEGMLAASHSGDFHPKGARSTPLPPALVTFDSKGRSPVADKAEAAAAAITEGGHHLLGSDIPKNLARDLKASATSFPSLSSDSISKSSAD